MLCGALLEVVDAKDFCRPSAPANADQAFAQGRGAGFVSMVLGQRNALVHGAGTVERCVLMRTLPPTSGELPICPTIFTAPSLEPQRQVASEAICKDIVSKSAARRFNCWLRIK